MEQIFVLPMLCPICFVVKPAAPPVAYIKSSRLFAVSGAPLAITCTAQSGSPPVFFSWLKDGENAATRPGIVESNTQDTSKFQVATFDSTTGQGVYSCVVTLDQPLPENRRSSIANITVLELGNPEEKRMYV